MDFPHLSSKGSFPNVDGVNVYQYDNAVDYTRFDYSQMALQVCNVPWDMGEAHIGNRTISGIGNVVHFGSESERDEWFDSIPDDKCYRFQTRFKELHRDGEIIVPLPFDIACKYNYLRVSYNLVANDDSPLMFEKQGGVRQWFWFIREVEFVAPNATRLILMNDAWQTFIYDLQIPWMVLERGHAPMFSVDAKKYLANPIGNCAGLLADDVNFGDAPRIVSDTESFIFNAKNMYAVIVSSCDPSGNFGTKAGGDWHTTSAYHQAEGVVSYWAFAVSTANLQTWVTKVSEDSPQFMRTIKAVCFVSSDLVTLNTANPFTFGTVSCYWVSAGYKTNNLVTLDKSMFGYDSKYANIAKLYTFPYAKLIVYDESGDATEIRIEDTNGTLQLESTVNLVYPWLKVDGHLKGVGRAAAKTLSFTNITTKNMPISGNWRDTLMQWDIPTFGINQMAMAFNDYDTHFDRVQQLLAAGNAYDNAAANADNTVANAGVTNAGNTAVTNASNANINNHSSMAQTYNSGIASFDNIMISANATSTIAANEQQGAIGAASSVASGAIGAITSGNPIGAAASLVGGVVGAASTLASTAVANALTAAQSANANISNAGHATAANTKTATDAGYDTTTASDITAAHNSVNSSHAANDSATMYANAARDLNTAQSAVDNQQLQAALNAPQEFGRWENGDYSTTRPMGVFCDVVTQDESAIRQAGDEFLRYGYAYNRQWAFDGNWNIGKHFTYWKLSDFWVRNLDIPDMYMDKLRFFLYGGVTVWRKPEDIGYFNIYQNA